MFSTNLKNIRLMKNMTQKELALKLNVSSKTISHWEAGYTEPSLSMLTLIKNALFVSYEELLD